MVDTSNLNEQNIIQLSSTNLTSFEKFGPFFFALHLLKAMHFLTFLLCTWFQTLYFTQSDGSANCESYRTVLRAVGLFDKKQKNLCCEIVGCFANEKHSDFQHWPSDPWCLDKIEPEFYLYTTKNDKINQTINVFNLTESIKKLDVDKSKELFAIIHGWNTQWNLSEWMFIMKDALIEKVWLMFI